MSRRVEIEPKAYWDMRSHAAFITTTVSASSAERWKDRIVAALKKLADQAERWPITEDPGFDGLNLHEANIGRRPHVYRILYDFDEERVIVHRIRHAAQDYLNDE